MDNLAFARGGNFALSSGAVAITTDTTKIKTTATITYVVNGEFKSKSATDNISIAYTGPTVYRAPAGVGTGDGSFTGGANGSTRVYGVYLDGAGNFSVVPGPIVDSAALAAGTAPLEFPGEQADKACVAAVRVAVTAGTTFVPGTTGLDATGVTDTYYNLAFAPAKPLTA